MSRPESERPLRMSEQALAPLRSISLCRWFLRLLLSRVAVGRLTVFTPDGERYCSAQGAHGPHATVSLNNWRAIRRLLFDGDIGLAEAYRAGDLQTPDLTALIEIGARNNATLRGLVSGVWPTRLFNRARHLLNANTRAGSRRNICAHYDLGNEFYAHWLDASMMYSSALYETTTETLETAQQRRLDRIVAMLGLSSDEHILEIGCGWGALAERLAREGCHVTAITLSPAQLETAQQRVARAGLSERVAIRLQDYRDVAGQFDRIVSIEMIEAVGRAYWRSYFDTLARSLRPGGRVVLQTITIDDALFESYQQGADFIQHSIFPGGEPPISAGAQEQCGNGRLRSDRAARLRRQLRLDPQGMAPSLPRALEQDRAAGI